MHPERREITEDRDGLPLRLGLRLLAADATTPLADVLVEVWQADHVGRYSGFQPFEARPGQVVTSESVPHDVIAAGETYLRGSQRTDQRGMCAFNTIYPGWYASRTVHIHLIAHLGDRSVTTQLYFPDPVTDQVFTRPPYRGRPQRDTTNATDSIFADGGEQMILDLQGDPTTGYTGSSASSSTRKRDLPRLRVLRQKATVDRGQHGADQGHHRGSPRRRRRRRRYRTGRSLHTGCPPA
ncbi:hypothetical protein [Micromonospora sp. MH33]|uniref:dioxygenase family protein n=1 Tax=Micromonospora sp. MH33 TaxID=1945509 RepID=UPI001AF01E9E|nr:hypothetical protein [Micromonospora sp. MH33]